MNNAAILTTFQIRQPLCNLMKRNKIFLIRYSLIKIDKLKVFWKLTKIFSPFLKPQIWKARKAINNCFKKPIIISLKE